MTKRVVAVRRLHETHLAQLRQAFHVDYFDKLDAGNHATYTQALRHAHGLIGSKLTVTPAMLDAAPDLEVISTISVGYDNIALDALTERNILLCHTPDVLTETTADTGFALILATARRVVELAELVRQGCWTRHIDDAHFGSDVHGKTLGMIGMGRIGAAVARRGALGFGMRVCYSNASPKPALEAELGAKRCGIGELLSQSDFVCLTLPHNAETHHLIAAEDFRRMKPSAIFINIARGQVVDEDAMISALQTGQIRGAGLDVFEQEPVSPNSPLLRMYNVVALPHIGSATHETRAAMVQRAVDNLTLALNGRAPISAVNRHVLATTHCTVATSDVTVSEG